MPVGVRLEHLDGRRQPAEQRVAGGGRRELDRVESPLRRAGLGAAAGGLGQQLGARGTRRAPVAGAAAPRPGRARTASSAGSSSGGFGQAGQRDDRGVPVERHGLRPGRRTSSSAPAASSPASSRPRPLSSSCWRTRMRTCWQHAGPARGASHSDEWGRAMTDAAWPAGRRAAAPGRPGGDRRGGQPHRRRRAARLHAVGGQRPARRRWSASSASRSCARVSGARAVSADARRPAAARARPRRSARASRPPGPTSRPSRPACAASCASASCRAWPARVVPPAARALARQAPGARAGGRGVPPAARAARRAARRPLRPRAGAAQRRRRAGRRRGTTSARTRTCCSCAAHDRAGPPRPAGRAGGRRRTATSSPRTAARPASGPSSGRCERHGVPVTTRCGRTTPARCARLWPPASAWRSCRGCWSSPATGRAPCRSAGPGCRRAASRCSGRRRGSTAATGIVADAVRRASRATLARPPRRRRQLLKQAL